MVQGNEATEDREHISCEENGFWLGAVVQSNFIPPGKRLLPF
jgi:hypothetical protein